MTQSKAKGRSSIKWGFWGPNQLPLFMMWREFYNDKGEVTYAYVILNSLNLIGF